MTISLDTLLLAAIAVAVWVLVIAGSNAI